MFDKLAGSGWYTLLFTTLLICITLIVGVTMPYYTWGYTINYPAVSYNGPVNFYIMPLYGLCCTQKAWAQQELSYENCINWDWDGWDDFNSAIQTDSTVYGFRTCATAVVGSVDTNPYELLDIPEPDQADADLYIIYDWLLVTMSCLVLVCFITCIVAVIFPSTHGMCARLYFFACFFYCGIGIAALSYASEDNTIAPRSGWACSFGLEDCFSVYGLGVPFLSLSLVIAFIAAVLAIFPTEECTCRKTSWRFKESVRR